MFNLSNLLVCFNNIDLFTNFIIPIYSSLPIILNFSLDRLTSSRDRIFRSFLPCFLYKMLYMCHKFSSLVFISSSSSLRASNCSWKEPPTSRGTMLSTTNKVVVNNIHSNVINNNNKNDKSVKNNNKRATTKTIITMTLEQQQKRQ